ncbi:helix-turn-helix domain-containing protein [Caulobacter sp. SLTY]|uniref:helix-turn-helix domain-containing protein n=1 Tax=Caulobacter sp. SLTY TaxID=2683262 RepID=UPI001413532E|nr:DNA-binding transcriptional regulator [Caulobacter sp. SLTY]NBB15558.1 helix-turn-helix domain-containing protein [Caulobacter sp. SLTY]
MSQPKGRTFKSEAFEAIHSAVSGMAKAGTISKETLRQFDETCLTPVQRFTPGRIKALRLANNVSQPVFASILNTSESTIQKWEAGAKAPSGPALKLLTLVEKHGLELLR